MASKRKHNDREFVESEKVKKGTVHIGPSDKGKGLVIMTPDLYHKMSVVHTEGDKKIDWIELGEAQRELRAEKEVEKKL